MESEPVLRWYQENVLWWQGYDECLPYYVLSVGSITLLVPLSRRLQFSLRLCFHSGHACALFLLFVQVLVGEFAVGSKNMVRPPEKNSNKDLYDSCVNFHGDPTIFVIFDCAHSYPEYIVEYNSWMQNSRHTSVPPSRHHKRGMNKGNYCTIFLLGLSHNTCITWKNCFVALCEALISWALCGRAKKCYSDKDEKWMSDQCNVLTTSANFWRWGMSINN